MTSRRINGVAALLWLLTGCGPILLQQGARTVGAGKTVVGMSTAVAHDQTGGKATNTYTGLSSGYIRHGIGDRMEIGLEADTGGYLRANGKIALVQGGAVSISFAPGLDLGYSTTNSNDMTTSPSDKTTGTTTTIGADGALIFGFKMGDGELFLAPRAGYFGVDENDTDNQSTPSTMKSHRWHRAFGSALGLTIPMGKLQVIPELGIYRVETGGGGSGTSLNGHETLIAPGIGIAGGF